MAEAARKTLRFQAVTPRVPVTDVERALSYYRDRLGFDLAWKWGNPLTHASVCRDSISLDLIAIPSEYCGTAMVYIQLSSVDAYYAELKARNVDSGEIGDREYGMRDFDVVDEWGNRLAFGTPLAE